MARRIVSSLSVWGCGHPALHPGRADQRNCRDACPFGSLFQPRDRLSYRQPKTQQFLATLKLKVVYDVDQ